MLRPNLRNIKTLSALYLLTFFLNMHAALPGYVHSTFLAEFTTEKVVGLLYTVAAVLSIFVFWSLPKILEKFGLYKTTIFFMSIEIMAVLMLSIAPSALVVFVSFIISIILIRIIGFNTDLFLENYSNDKNTGGTRGFFLAATNFAWVLSPIVAGYILGDDMYSRLYFVSILFLIPLFLIILGKFKNFKDPEYKEMTLIKSFRLLEKKDNVRKIILSNTVLRFFYSWMVIYTPIYLRDHIGLEWSDIGIIFTIMLLPFIIFEYPLGKLADKRFGEKEMLVIGFIILAVSTASLSFISTTSVLVWGGLLFMTRVGASFVEAMNETYFFKKIDGRDSSLVSFFRMTGPLAYIFGPIIATFLLYFIDFRYLFLSLGIMVLWGLKYAFTIKDTL